jgi:hypothetical protein
MHGSTKQNILFHFIQLSFYFVSFENIITWIPMIETIIKSCRFIDDLWI